MYNFLHLGWGGPRDREDEDQERVRWSQPRLRGHALCLK